ncbi:MAG: hypothetical protein K2W85_00530 [Phycisphaerales bacterium]|nr:hypothetical protein [Phycisphaerales bacterium]
MRLHFKPAGQDVRLLVIHSTAEPLGEHTAKALDKALVPGIVRVGIHRAADFRELVSMIDKAEPFNVLLLIAHGDNADFKFWLHGDKDASGQRLGVNPMELKAALGDKAHDTLIMFGVCHHGTEELAEAMVEHAGALASVAVRPGEKISKDDIAIHFATFLNAMQAAKTIGVGPYELAGFLRDSVPKELFKRLAIVPDLPGQ